MVRMINDGELSLLYFEVGFYRRILLQVLEGGIVEQLSALSLSLV